MFFMSDSRRSNAKCNLACPLLLYHTTIFIEYQMINGKTDGIAEWRNEQSPEVRNCVMRGFPSRRLDWPQPHTESGGAKSCVKTSWMNLFPRYSFTKSFQGKRCKRLYTISKLLCRRELFQPVYKWKGCGNEITASCHCQYNIITSPATRVMWNRYHDVTEQISNNVTYFYAS